MPKTNDSAPPTRLEAQIHHKPKKQTLLTEDLPAGGLTQEDFDHDGNNVMETTPAKDQKTGK